jgi:hypothetical protein
MIKCLLSICEALGLVPKMARFFFFCVLEFEIRALHLSYSGSPFSVGYF